MSEQVITVADMIRQINAAVERMSKANPHRRLLLHCGQVIIDLAQRPTAGSYSVTVPEETVLEETVPC